MNRTFYILFGAVIILLLVAVWVYLMFLAPPREAGEGIFANLNFGDTTDTGVMLPDENDPIANTVVDTTDPGVLRQLTTTPVLAYREVQATTTPNPHVRYVEAGTGHVFSIDLVSGATTRLTATTIPVATKAAMSPNGSFVVVRSGDSFAAEHVVGFVDAQNEKLLTTTIEEFVVDFVIPNNEEILYGVQLQNSYAGKRYSLETGESTTLFTIPFREVSVAWGEGSSATHYAYPKASRELEGFVYKITNGTLRRLPVSGYGLSLVSNGDTTIFSRLETSRTTQEYVSYGYNAATDDFAELPFTVIPEKCSPYSINNFICGTPLDLVANAQLPDSWYQGRTTTADYLWSIAPLAGSATALANLTSAAAREIDVSQIVVSADQSNTYFTDRYNRYLWTLDLTAR